ncbi:extracellular solute-binding protein [Bergeriella denitrificans]|uniref:Oligopeptide-binding protein AppA n=1 Tax=Bergeriella denitrificans TaxID=494 RepID=A0A378UFB2_BERDE|nr:extracellular solute-binding protein [Bergeriella denitrificans]STZ75389.1 Oligopeptide-binding protein AppA precursor [Bergeriella denitrificans]
MITKLPALLLFAAALLAAPARADHGLSLGQPPKYAAGFPSFDYVRADAPKGGTLTLPLPGGFDTLNPFTLKGDHESGMAMLTLDTLMEKSWDEPFAVYGLLAEDVRVAPDGLSVTFRINPRARFHNGDPVLAKDVAASFNTLTADPAAAPMYKFYWGDVARVETPAPRTVVFHFKQRNSELPLILGELPVFSHKSYPKGLASAANTPPIGSGPYRFAKAERGRQSEYRRDPQYWAQNLPVRKGRYNFDTVRFKYYKDDSVRIEGLKGGQYDFMQENVARNWARAYPEAALQKRGLAKHEWTHRNTAGMQGFVMNTRKPPFDNILVRRAMVESFDFETTNSRMFYSAYRRSNSFFTNSELAARGRPEGAELALLNPLKAQLPPQVFAQDAPEPPRIDAAQGVRPNLLKARALLEQAGYRYRNGVLVDKQGRPLAFEFLSPSKTYERVTAKWQRDLAKIGVKMTVRTADSAVFQKRMTAFDFDMTIVVYANSNSPGNEQAMYFGCEAARTEGSRNWAGVCLPAVEALLKKFEHFNSRTELVAAARALDRVMRHQYIVVPNWYADTYRVVYRDTLGFPATMPLYYSPMERALSVGWYRK